MRAPRLRPSTARSVVVARVLACGGVAALATIAACAVDAAPPSPARTDGSLAVERASIPCAPRAVLEAVCQRCHASPPVQGAPFPFVTHADVTRALDGEPTYVHMARAVESGRMPLDPYALTPAQRATLLDWFADGAPSVTLGTSCAPEAEAEPPDGGAAEDDASSGVQGTSPSSR